MRQQPISSPIEVYSIKTSLVHLLFNLFEHYLQGFCEVIGCVRGKQGYDFVLQVFELHWGDDVQTDDHLVYAISHFLQL